MNIRNKTLLTVIMLIISTDLAVILNIPIIRPVFGFIFLTFLPGFLFLNIIRLNKLNFLKQFLLSWGLSLAIIMIYGLIINLIAIGIGFDSPLSTNSLLIAFNVLLLFMTFYCYKKNIFNNQISIKSLMGGLFNPYIITPIIFVYLSIIGVLLMNIYNNNIVLLILLFLISFFIIITYLGHKKVPNKTYPISIYFISLSLVLMLALRSDHIIGADVFTEFLVFKYTFNQMQWNLITNSILEPCLSISILPAIYNRFLNLEPEFLFKILFALLCSIFPLVIYSISKKYVYSSFAFIAAIFFMTNQNFLWTEANARASIAMLFIALSIFSLFVLNVNEMKKKLLFIIFMVAAVFSHYASAYIFFFILTGMAIGSVIFTKRIKNYKNFVSISLAILAFLLIFTWYSQISGTAFDLSVFFFKNTLLGLQNFFSEDLRSSAAQTLYGSGILEKNSITILHFILTWTSFLLIGMGLIGVLLNRMNLFFGELSVKNYIIKKTFDTEYLIISVTTIIILFLIFAFPFISQGYGLGRAFPIASTVLSVFFVIGSFILLSFIKKLALNYKRLKKLHQVDIIKYSKIITLIILIPYFLCITGAMYAIFELPFTVVLSSNGSTYDNAYVHGQEISGINWLISNKNDSRIFSDIYGQMRIKTYSGKLKYYMDNSNVIILNEKTTKIKGYIFLRYFNVVNDTLITYNDSKINITNYNEFYNINLIFDNGGSKILFK